MQSIGKSRTGSTSVRIVPESPPFETNFFMALIGIPSKVVMPKQGLMYI